MWVNINLEVIKGRHRQAICSDRRSVPFADVGLIIGQRGNANSGSILRIELWRRLASIIFVERNAVEKPPRSFSNSAKPKHGDKDRREICSFYHLDHLDCE